MRKIATTVPATISRLLQSTLLDTPPTWYLPLLSHPPPTLPPRQLKPRPSHNHSHAPTPKRQTAGAGLDPSSTANRTRKHQMKHMKEPKPRPGEIEYQEDRIRRQFFRDFPFEALRPVSLVEGLEVGEEHSVRGKEWTELGQRGMYPTVEDCIQFTLTLQNHHHHPITQAYAIATKQFVDLRADHELATKVAAAEARHYGAEMHKDPFTRTMRLERLALDALSPSSTSSSTGSSVKKKTVPAWAWTSTVSPSALPSGEFTGGEEYMQRWKLPPPVRLGTGTGTGASGAGAGAGGKTSAPAISFGRDMEDERRKKVQEAEEVLELLTVKA